jgi:hypothetical protein
MCRVPWAWMYQNSSVAAGGRAVNLGPSGRRLHASPPVWYAMVHMQDGFPLFSPGGHAGRCPAIGYSRSGDRG